MIQETAVRAQGDGFAAPIVISNQDHRFLIAEQLRAAGIRGARIMSGTRRAQHRAGGVPSRRCRLCRKIPTDMMLIMPSDHAVLDVAPSMEGVAAARKGGAAGRAGDLRHPARRT
jgi:mannose-1-phosphate guanylyltransferase/mannose-6-phosphate isomerase